jgi:outer membrane immunogenic protein
MKRILSAVILTAALTAPGLAADLGARTYTKAPVVAPVSNWSGFYVGGNLGYGWGSANTDIFDRPPAPDFHTTLGARSSGVIGGAQLGYNWQVGSLVTGLEADIQGSGIKGSTVRSSLINHQGLPEDPSNFLSSDQKLSWFGTVRGRLGVTVTPDLLLYGTAGVAYGEVNNSANQHFLAFFDGKFLEFPASARKTKAGWTAGAGGEWMFARNWSAKVEYLHVDLGNVSAVGDEVDHFLTLQIPRKSDYTWKAQEDIVRVGVNYHFN